MSIDKCEVCGSYNGLPTDSFRAYRIESEYSHLCRACAEQENTHTVDEMTDVELCAAIMDDSIGYAMPGHAIQHVEQYRESDGPHDDPFVWCERGRAVFPADPDDYADAPPEVKDTLDRGPGDLYALIERARKSWCGMDDDKRERLVEMVKETQELDSATQMGLSSLYPTNSP
jgi:hypothetical protein